MDIIIVSYGGSCSNTLVNRLEANGYCCNTLFWRDILCHCPVFLDIKIPIIYIYDDIRRAFLSVKNRKLGWWDINQKKLSNNNNVVLSDENLLQLMIKQFKTWTVQQCSNVLIIKSKDLFDQKIVNKLRTFLNNTKLHSFPVRYNKPKTRVLDNILFNKYYQDIRYINNFQIQSHR